MNEIFVKIIIFAVYNFIPSFRLERSGMEKSNSYFTEDFSTSLRFARNDENIKTIRNEF